ncbi:unnamed protein product [Acanthoscelides obtectus]|uniref:Uncharacterized protein n=1 Tax=Acanthoscelides obtectus TaxID=200917 RepID=A0A9P0P6G5_ACAOB|nr:unnamed protein product [Acanthoscelides obtectus]CAK1626358.1 hypothetical protein AOBTE_LOCUS3801 [Acanthoscelides obtectus]
MFKEDRKHVKDEHRVLDCERRLSPDLAPADFFLFPRIKRVLKGDRFGSIEAVQAATTKTLNSIPETDFQRSFDGWQQFMDEGKMYFEDY